MRQKSSVKKVTLCLSGRISSIIFSEYKENCSLQEVEVHGARYLKYACIYDKIMWYRCPHTHHYYGISVETEGDCYRTEFDKACPGDTHFYQACGHGGCAGFEACEIYRIISIC